MPWFEIQKGLVADATRPQGFMRLGLRDGGKSRNVRNQVRLNISSGISPPCTGAKDTARNGCSHQGLAKPGRIYSYAKHSLNEIGQAPQIIISFYFCLRLRFFQKRGPHKVGDANKFIPRCALNFEEHDVRYAGLDRSAVGSRKYFTALALSKGVGLRLPGHSPSMLTCLPQLKSLLPAGL